MKIRREQKKYKCGFCSYSTDNRERLVEHTRTHTKEKPYKCPHPTCSSSFAQKVHLRTHGLLVHSSKNDESLFKFKCQLSGCNYKAVRLEDLKTHQRTHSDARPFPCLLCPYRAKIKHCLNIHHKSVHSTEKPLKCPQPRCNYSCKLRAELISHLKTHSDKRPFACSFPDCTYKAKRVENLRAHIRGHSDERTLACSVPGCNYKAKISQNLKSHETIHSQKNPFKCSFCPYATTRNFSLTTHIRKHTGETPFLCQRCPYQAKSFETLTRHVKACHSSHEPTNLSGPSPSSSWNNTRKISSNSVGRTFACFFPGCSYKGKKTGDVKSHARIHPGVKPQREQFKCDFCPFSCACRSHLIRHRRVHTGERPFPCQICSYRAKTSYSLVSHEKRHLDSTSKKFSGPNTLGTFVCKVAACDYSTEENANFAIHLNNVHNLPKVVL